MKHELTPWFPAHIKPVRKGWYRTDLFSSVYAVGSGYSYWNGRWWGCEYPSFIAPIPRTMGEQEKKWQGLTHPARKPAAMTVSKAIRWA